MFQADKKPILFNKELTGNPIAFNSRLKNMPLSKCEINIPVTQTGSGTPSPDNIRDFIGVSGVNVSRTGKNLTTIFTDGKVPSISTGELVNAGGGRSDFVPVLPNTYYTFSIANAAQNLYIFYYNGNHGFISFDSLSSQTLTGQTPNNCAYIMLRTTVNASQVIDAQLEKGSQATPYEPYTGNTYLISFGQTVYSANLDVLTGKLSITHELKTIDENTSIYMGTETPSVFFINDFFSIDEDNYNRDSKDCNRYLRAVNKGSVNAVFLNNTDYSFCCKNGASGKRLMIKDTRFTTIEDYKTWLSTNPVKIAVKLAEPIQIPLGGYLIEALKGKNNLISSVGTITAKIVEVK